MEEFITKIDNNTFVLGSLVLSYLERTNSGDVYNEIDEILKMDQEHQIYIITTPAVLNYLTKFHKLEFETMFIGGISFHMLDYTATKKVNFIIQ